MKILGVTRKVSTSTLTLPLQGGGDVGATKFSTQIYFGAPLTPYPPPSSAGKAGEVGEDCLSSAVRRGVCASPGRVPQPPAATSNAGYPEGMAEWGGLSLPTFFGRSKKVGSCRAAPGAERCEALGRGRGVAYSSDRPMPIYAADSSRQATWKTTSQKPSAQPAVPVESRSSASWR